MKNLTRNWRFLEFSTKLSLTMKITTFLLFLAIFNINATNYAQNTKITLNLEDVTVEKVLNEIEALTEFKFLFNRKDVNVNRRISIQVEKQKIKTILENMFSNENVSFEVFDKQIILKVEPKEKIISTPVLEKKQQIEISGTVTDNDDSPLPGASILVKGTTTGTTTDFDGKFTLSINDNDTTLVISFIGFATQEVEINNRTIINIQLIPEESSLDEILLIGTRNKNRTAIDTPVPVDVFDISEITSKSGQITINEILNSVAPSFTSQTQTVSDGTDHIDPASLRGLGPDQVLVLINGKRRHNSSLLNINSTVGAGSVGTDMNSIPTASIKRIEMLRDGAAAQYGSDAIAGVINIILKNDTNKLNLAITTGANFSDKSNHQDGGVDGEKIQIDANYGLNLGDNGGYINFTGSLSTRQPALRNATNLEQIYDIANAVENAFTSATGTPISDMSAADYQAGAAMLGANYISPSDQAAIAAIDVNTPGGVDALSALLPNGGSGEFATYQELDAAQFALRGQERNDFRFKVGTSKLREGKFFANMSLPVSEKTDLYAFGGISYRQGLGYGFLREPWRPKSNTSVNKNGGLPGIKSDILDQSFAIGLKGELESGWFVDFSNTFGANSFAFTVVESTNASLGAASPSDFNAGSFRFAQNTTNLDVSKYHEDIFYGLNVAFGAEYRVEHFQIFEGDENSFTTYDIFGIPTVGGVGGATNALGESLPGTS